MADKKQGQISKLLLLGAEEHIRVETSAIHKVDGHQHESQTILALNCNRVERPTAA